MSQEPSDKSWRGFLKSTLVAISTATMPAGVRPLLVGEGRQSAAQTEAKPQQFLTVSERTFLKAAVDRLIPHDEHWPEAVEAGVLDYIDLQMASAWGRGEQFYRHGPFRKGSPSPLNTFHTSLSHANSVRNVYLAN
jgi:gluconate 2-dehydrogenase gamma chain